MKVSIPLSKLEDKNNEVYYIRYTPNKFYYYLLSFLFFIFICTLLGYIFTKNHDIGWLYINFLFGLGIMILLCPHIIQLYISCVKKQQINTDNEGDINFN